MVKLEKDKRAERAVERAFQARPRVRVLDRAQRRYAVDSTHNPGVRYVVQFSVDGAGGRYAECTCAAGQHDQICVHAVSALAVHMGIAKLFHETDKAKGAKNAGR